MFGAVSAVINLQPSIRLTFEAAREQLLVHILGVLIAFAIGFTAGASPLSMGLVVVIIIWLYLRLRLHRGVLMGIVAALFVMSSSPDQFISHALSRTGVIFIGLMVAAMVNVLLFRPRYRGLLLEKLRTSSQENVQFFRILTMLLGSCETVVRVNQKPRFSICDGLPVDPEPLSESLWEQLKDAMEEWQNKNSGSYYSHALLDLSVVAASIRGVARRGKELV